MKPERIRLQSPIAWGLTCLVSTAGSIAALVVTIVGTNSSGPGRAAGIIPLVFLLPIALVTWHQLTVGLDHILLNDVVFSYVVGKQKTDVPLTQLGPLTITEYKRLRTTRAATWHKLEAAGLPKVVLFEAINPKPVEALKARLEAAMDATQRAAT